MDYFKEAFGEFNPQGDPHVAVKFVLNIILMDDRFDDLACLLTDGHDIGGIEGEPGWIVERRDLGSSGDGPGYADWPMGTNFRVYVDQDSFDLAYPEIFLTIKEFYYYVHKAIEAYQVRNPSKLSTINTIASHINANAEGSI